MLSIMPTTLSKLTFFPRIAKEMRSRRKSCFLPPFSARRAWCNTSLLEYCTWMKLDAGMAFLNKSRASSSLRTLMVSARAMSSSARVFTISSHSPPRAPQSVSKVCRKAASSLRVFLESSRSSAAPTSSMPTSPRRAVFVSTADLRAAISFSLASMRASYCFVDSTSAVLASSKSFSMSSLIVLMMPRISEVDEGTSSSSPCWPCRKTDSESRSASLRSASGSIFRSADATGVCKKEPSRPFERAATALPNDAMFVLLSVLLFSKARASLERRARASATAASAETRSFLACPMSWASCVFSALPFSMSLSKRGILVVASVTLSLREALPVSHWHMNLSYRACSFLPSSVILCCMSCSMATTRRTGFEVIFMPVPVAEPTHDSTANTAADLIGAIGPGPRSGRRLSTFDRKRA
mmetsp:Transcript_99556/g.319539  ORF Transcript_99556/g.319539 Transcript_99556/m.319539 type:complete len:412 (-) Transcript_99556:2-1237(-)